MISDIKTTSGNRILWLGIALILLYLLLYIFPLGSRPLAIPDETRYAEIPREMLASGDWVTPRLNNLRYFEKPPLGYWANAISLSVFGETPFAVRLSSALAAGLTSLLIYFFSVKIVGDRRTALLAAFIHLTFFEVYIIGTFSVLDNLLTLFLSAGIISFYLALQEERKKIAWAYWSASGITLGLAFLTKGFLALAIPVVVMVPWLIWQGYWRPLLVQGWYVVLVAVFVALPWGLLIHFQQSDFWHYFFWVEHIKRFTAENAQHKAPFYYFLVVLPVVAFPWFSLIPAAMKGLASVKKSVKNKKRLGFLWLWLLLPFLFFSLSSGKLVTYILPCFAPLAILMAIGLNHYLQRDNTRLFNVGIGINIFLLGCLLLIILVSQFFDIGFSLYNQGEVLRLLITTLTLLTGIIAGLLALRSYSSSIRLILCLFFAVPFMFFMQFATPNQLRESKAPGEFLTKFSENINEDTLLVSDGAVLRAVNWFLKRDDVYLFNAGEVTYGLGYPDAKDRFLDPDKFSALITSNPNRSIAIFCRKGCPQDIRDKIPENSQNHRYGKFSIWYIQSQDKTKI